MAGFKGDNGWSNDLSKIREIVTKYLRDWGLDSKFQGIMLNDKGEPQVTGDLQLRIEQAMNEMIAEAQGRTEKLLLEHWAYVRSVVAELLRKGEIRGPRFEEIGRHIKQKSQNKNWRGKGPVHVSCSDFLK